MEVLSARKEDGNIHETIRNSWRLEEWAQREETKKEEEKKLSIDDLIEVMEDRGELGMFDLAELLGKLDVDSSIIFESGVFLEEYCMETEIGLTLRFEDYYKIYSQLVKISFILERILDRKGCYNSSELEDYTLVKLVRDIEHLDAQMFPVIK